MTHQHQFILIEQTHKKPQAREHQLIGSRWEDENGAKCGCPLCGEIRIIWANGGIEIIKNGHNDEELKKLEKQ